ncbi:MAG: hypothetical protein K0R29_2954 [Pseudobdellovibrio sp.]|nr:hypothetical protein [Pseudobdellovibrio sp.]
MESIIQTKHKDRYRIQFCDENFYRRYQNVFEMWQKRFKSLENVEKLQAWVTVLSCLRRPNDWYGGPRALPIVSTAMLTTSSLDVDVSCVLSDKNYNHKLTLSEIFEGSPVLIPSKLPSSMNLFDFLNAHRIKALPESCFRSLCYIRTGRYPLRLSSGVVSPFELLQIQFRGERIVSMDEDFSAWPERLYSGRDYLCFVIHDLIHADHFFYEPQHRDRQLGFYKFVNSFINDESLAALLNGSSSSFSSSAADANGGAELDSEKPTAAFREGFEYIISDMNSHPLHLFQTLHSLLFKSVSDDVTASGIWRRWLALAANSSAGKSGYDSLHGVCDFSVLERINARDFSFEEAKAVESLCMQLALS